MKRFFGMMNVVYAGRSIDDHDFNNVASQFVFNQLATLPTDDELDALSIVDLAALLRSIVYGVDWVDRRLMPSLAVTATRVILDSTNEGPGL